MKAHMPPTWRGDIYFILVVEDFDVGSFANVGLHEEGQHDKVINAELVISHKRGIYGFSNKEAADKFRRTANGAGALERPNAYDVSEQL